MTAKELKDLFNKEYGFNPWPPTYEVDAETYGNVCQAVFNNALDRQFPDVADEFFHLKIVVGPNIGIMYQNVELILKVVK